MNKKEIKAVIKRLKFYDAQLNERRSLIDKIDAKDFKSQRRYLKETEVCAKLFQVFIYEKLPVEHGSGNLPVTKGEALRLMSGDEARENEGKITRSGLTFLYMTLDEFKLFKEIYDELIINK